MQLSRLDELDWPTVWWVWMDAMPSYLMTASGYIYVWSNSGVQEMWPLAFCIPMNRRRRMVAKPRIWAQGISVLSCLRTIKPERDDIPTKPWTWIHGITVLSYHSTIISVDRWISKSCYPGHGSMECVVALGFLWSRKSSFCSGDHLNLGLNLNDSQAGEPLCHAFVISNHLGNCVWKTGINKYNPI